MSRMTTTTTTTKTPLLPAWGLPVALDFKSRQRERERSEIFWVRQQRPRQQQQVAVEFIIISWTWLLGVVNVPLLLISQPFSQLINQWLWWPSEQIQWKYYFGPEILCFVFAAALNGKDNTNQQAAAAAYSNYYWTNWKPVDLHALQLERPMRAFNALSSKTQTKLHSTNTKTIK